jgi:hypothetical protein
VIVTLGEAAPGVEHRNMAWVQLPARPMIDVPVESAPKRERVEASLRLQLSRLPPDAIVRVLLQGPWSPGARLALGAANLRGLAPATMNITVHEPRQMDRGITSARGTNHHKISVDDVQ